MGEKILALRKARGWSQEELAERVGVTRQAVSRWEASAAKPDADKIIALCDLFGISADYLLREDYRGEVAHSEPAKPKLSAKERWGRYLAIAGAGGLFIMKIAQSVFPASYLPLRILRSGKKIMPEDTIDGFLGFVMYRNLEWLFVLLLACVAVGLVLIWKENKTLRESVIHWLKNIRISNPFRKKEP